MLYRDIQDFAKTLEDKGLLKRIGSLVDPVLEITEITDRISKSSGPALLFERVKGSDFPVLINTFGSIERMKMALGCKRLDSIGNDIMSFLDSSNYFGLYNKIKMLPKLGKMAFIFPRRITNPPCQQVIEEEVDLDKIPVLKCWPGDGGRFITLPLVFTKDPETGKQNMGMYRMQVFDKKTTGMHWHLHHDGAQNYSKHCKLKEPMEVAVAIGADPVTIYSATAPVPRDIYELIFAGFIRKQGVETTRCKTVDLEVPAHAEFILEGYVEPDKVRMEGPFGDHTGYYSLTDEYPVFNITCITRKKNPIYPATIVGRPPMEDCYLGKATERIFLPVLKMLYPEIIDINMPLEGVFHNCVVVSIDKSYPGHGKKIMNSLWGIGQMMYVKMIVVVDKNVDPQDLSAVAWKVFNNIDARRDVVLMDGPLDALDHASPLPHFGCRMGIDATRKWPQEGHTRLWPEDIVMDEDIKRMVDSRWKEYGF